jgi:hypothetical protein
MVLLDAPKMYGRTVCMAQVLGTEEPESCRGRCQSCQQHGWREQERLLKAGEEATEYQEAGEVSNLLT